MAFALGGLLFPGVMTQANLMVKYCSGLNTGSSTNRGTAIYHMLRSGSIKPVRFHGDVLIDADLSRRSSG